MLVYDNLDDAKVKLQGTFCYYDGKAVMVREVIPQTNEVTGEMEFVIRLQALNARSYTHTTLNDPKFNYMSFNLGYSNHGHSSVWWYRVPMKQYHQGLKQGQLKRIASNSGYVHSVEWNFSKPITDMLENRYPKFAECEQLLKDEDVGIVAFHKDFACTWDKVHKDLIIEYKGKLIGCMDSKYEFKPMDDCEHLAEALKEAVA